MNVEGMNAFNALSNLFARGSELAVLRIRSTNDLLCILSGCWCDHENLRLRSQRLQFRDTTMHDTTELWQRTMLTTTDTFEE